MVDRFIAELVVPRFIGVHLAQPVPGAVLGQPGHGVGVRDVDRLPGYVRRCLGSGDPSGGFLFGPVPRDGLTKEPSLVFRGAPAAFDEERDLVARSVCGG